MSRQAHIPVGEGWGGVAETEPRRPALPGALRSRNEGVGLAGGIGCEAATFPTRLPPGRISPLLSIMLSPPFPGFGSRNLYAA